MCDEDETSPLLKGNQSSSERRQTSHDTEGENRIGVRTWISPKEECTKDKALVCLICRGGHLIKDCPALIRPTNKCECILLHVKATEKGVAERRTVSSKPGPLSPQKEVPSEKPMRSLSSLGTIVLSI